MTPAIFILILSLPLTGFAESVDSKIQEGISQYHEGKFKDAGQSFSSARVDRPDDSRIPYNQGNAHYKEGSFPEALQAFTQSSLDKKNPDIRKNAIYNTGNTLVKLGKLKEAESAYKKVLRLDPDDMDAKFNLEYIREQLKKKEEQDSDQGKQKNEDNNSDYEKEQGANEDPQSENQQPPPRKMTLRKKMIPPNSLKSPEWRVKYLRKKQSGYWKDSPKI